MWFKGFVLSAAILGFSAHAEKIDFGKVNGVLDQISSELIKDSSFFTNFDADIDAQRTDFDAGKAGGSVSIGVAATQWSKEPSSIGFSGATTKTGEVVRTIPGDDENKPLDVVMVVQDVQIGGNLKTQILPFASFVWTSWGYCENLNPEDTLSGYVGARVCNEIKRLMENLTETSDLIDAGVSGLSTAIGSTRDFIVIKTKELDETQNENKKVALRYEIERAQSAYDFLDGIQVVRSRDTMEATLDIKKVKLTFTLNPQEVALNLALEWEFNKESFDSYMQYAKATVLGIQNEDAEVLKDVRESLKGTLEAVESIARGE